MRARKGLKYEFEQVSKRKKGFGKSYSARTGRKGRGWTSLCKRIGAKQKNPAAGQSQPGTAIVWLRNGPRKV